MADPVAAALGLSVLGPLGLEPTGLARLAAVWAMALEVWDGAAAARRFMLEEHMLLHGRRPVDVVLENELGRPAVEGILGRLQNGSDV